MIRSICVLVLSAFTLAAPGPVAAQPVRFDDVVRNLRHPDAKVRVNAVRLLREARYPEAIIPMAALANDPVDAIQLEAIAAELAFFLVEDIPDKKRVALLVEVRTPGRASAAFERGPLAAWPRPVPIEVVNALLQAVDDDNQRVRAEAIYALGAIAPAPLPEVAVPALIKALDHYDPVIRAAAARVIGRLEVKAAADALIKSVNDSNATARYAAMRALGELREQRALQALTDQFNFYGKGEGAWAALEALARIGHSSSVPMFTARLTDKDPFLRRAAAEGLGRSGDTSGVSALEAGAGNDPSEMVRAAM
ncbi:MAG: HEAT repeat domain-containing protein, partial [Acidobacteria bacterium]|nr:HEAT repeat domain-containing protein [Acidobacteriota bacterium]